MSVAAPVVPAWKSFRGVKRVQAEVKHLRKELDAGRLPGIKDLEILGDDVMKWQFKIFSFDEDVQGGKDLNNDLRKLDSKYGQDHILMEISFPPDYPNKPFFIRVVSPRCRMYTGHVTAGGSICLEALTTSGTSGSWQPDFSVESMLNVIILNMIDCPQVYIQTATGPGGLSGPLRIDFDQYNPTRGYSPGEARSAFDRTLHNHRRTGWGGPPPPAQPAAAGPSTGWGGPPPPAQPAAAGPSTGWPPPSFPGALAPPPHVLSKRKQYQQPQAGPPPTMPLLAAPMLGVPPPAPAAPSSRRAAWAAAYGAAPAAVPSSCRAARTAAVAAVGAASAVAAAPAPPTPDLVVDLTDDDPLPKPPPRLRHSLHHPAAAQAPASPSGGLPGAAGTSTARASLKHDLLLPTAPSAVTSAAAAAAATATIAGATRGAGAATTAVAAAAAAPPAGVPAGARDTIDLSLDSDEEEEVPAVQPAGKRHKTDRKERTERRQKARERQQQAAAAAATPDVEVVQVVENVAPVPVVPVAVQLELRYPENWDMSRPQMQAGTTVLIDLPLSGQAPAHRGPKPSKAHTWLGSLLAEYLTSGRGTAELAAKLEQAAVAAGITEQAVGELTEFEGITPEDALAALLLARGESRRAGVGDALALAVSHMAEGGAAKLWAAQEGLRRMGRADEVEVKEQQLKQEADAVLAQLLAGGIPKSQVVSVQRVQNPALWRKYWLFRQDLEQRVGTPWLQEKQLYHGAGLDSIDAIVEEGFDIRLANVCGAFGKGTYFAELATTAKGYCIQKVLPGQAPVQLGAPAAAYMAATAAMMGGGAYGGRQWHTQRLNNGVATSMASVAWPYSNVYGAPAPALGCRQKLILARVVLGKQVAGRSGLVRPPAGSHSVYGDLVGKCHVVFDNHQAYPEYVITLGSG